MLPKLRKKLLLQTAVIAMFSLAGFLILLYVTMQALADPRVLKRMLGFDSFAGFLLTSGSGILGVVLLASILFLLVRRIFFAKTIHGQTDALHRILSRFESGDLNPAPDELTALPPVLRRDVEALRDSLFSRFDTVQQAVHELGEVSRNLQRMTVDSSLRISFLNAQVESLSANLTLLQDSLDQLQTPRPDHVRSILVVGDDPSAAALMHALTIGSPASRLYQICEHPDHIHPAATHFETGTLEDIPNHAQELGIALVFLSQPHSLPAELCDHLASNGIPVFGRGSRTHVLQGETLSALLDRYHIPRLPWAVVSSPSEALAFAATHKGPWRIEARRIQDDIVPLFHDATALSGFLSSHPGIFGDRHPVTIACGERSRDFSLIALSDRTCMKMLGCAELDILSGDNDTGAATSGCGAFTPTLDEGDPVTKRIASRILGRLHGALRREGIVWHGFVTLRIHVTHDGHPYLQRLTFGLLSPEADAILASAHRMLVPACLAALRDELEVFSPEARTVHAISIVFFGEAGIPPAPAGTAIIPYHTDSERAFSLVCMRSRIDETIHAAYLAALPLIRSNTVHCRQDIGGRTLLAREAGKRRQLRMPGSSRFRRIYEWLLGTWSSSGKRRST